MGLERTPFQAPNVVESFRIPLEQRLNTAISSLISLINLLPNHSIDVRKKRKLDN